MLRLAGGYNNEKYLYYFCILSSVCQSMSANGKGQTRFSSGCFQMDDTYISQQLQNWISANLNIKLQS